MGKLLRFLSVLFLVLSIAALTLGILLFEKREQLKGRTQKLEETLIKLAKFIEGAPAEPETATFTAKDTSDCTPEVLENPERSPFWSTYHLQMEKQNLTTVDLNPKREQLKNYYLLDAEGKIVKDPETGIRLTDGRGTMQAVLTDILGKTEEQLKRFNETRNELRVVREELVATVEDLNKRKADLRKALAEIVALNETIAQRDQTIAALNQTIDGLKADIAARDDTIAQQVNQIAQLELDKEEQKKEINRLRLIISEGFHLPIDEIPLPEYRRIDMGDKGTVSSLNDEWNYVVLDVTEAFMQELVGKDKSAAFTPVELLLKRPKRPDEALEFVTKVRITNIKRDKNLAIGNILSDWQVRPVQKGDVLYYMFP